MAYRVLIIDDDESLRLFAAEVLQSHGHTVEMKADAQDLLADVRHSPPDVVLLDYQMPGIDGLTALRQLRHARENVPVIMLTASSGQNTAVECFRAGANDFVSKPFDPDYLDLIVRRTVDHASTNLRDMTLSLLRFARHLDLCNAHEGAPCSCGMSETVRSVSAMMKSRTPFD